MNWDISDRWQRGRKVYSTEGCSTKLSLHLRQSTCVNFESQLIWMHPVAKNVNVLWIYLMIHCVCSDVTIRLHVTSLCLFVSDLNPIRIHKFNLTRTNRQINLGFIFIEAKMYTSVKAALKNFLFRAAITAWAGMITLSDTSKFSEVGWKYVHIFNGRDHAT